MSKAADDHGQGSDVLEITARSSFKEVY